MKNKTLKRLEVILSVLLWLGYPQLSAQNAITAIQTSTSISSNQTTYTDNGAPGSPLVSNTYNYTFASSNFTDHVVSLKALQAANKAYAYEPIPVQVIFRRVNNNQVSNPRDLLYYFGNLDGSYIHLKAPYEPDMTSAFVGNSNIMRGSDNVFSNAGDGNGNHNNIERLDVMIPGGITLNNASGQGFAVMERGAVGQHDPFVVAVVTAVDGAGNPIAYSNLLRVNSTHYGTTNVVPNQNSIVLRRDNGSGNLLASVSLSGQGIGGIFFSFADFGLTNGQTIYGYSLTANDFPVSATPADFVDYTNSVYFPLNTSGTGPGGLDMIAFTGLVRIMSISGNVLHDPDGLANNQIDGTGIQLVAGNNLYVNIIDANNLVVGTAAVQPDGSFVFEGLPFGTYTLELSVNQGNVGNSPPIKTLGDSQWVYTGSAAGNSAPPLNLEGFTTITLIDENITGIGFGIQQRPLASNYTAPQIPHPGDQVPFPVQPTLFNASDPDGFVTSLIINAFPVNASTITINNITYNSGNFPVNGVVVPANVNGHPTVPIQVALPIAETSVTISFLAVDNAGFSSLTAGQVVLPLVAGGSGNITNLYPSTGPGTLAFEDLWPAKGDYDFNDLVIDYQFEITSDNANMVQQLKASFTLKAFGASYENGFGFQLMGNVLPQDVLSVSGNYLTENIITLEPNGTESGQSKPTFIVFDNAFAHMPHPGMGIGVNTTPGAPYVPPVDMELIITFKPNTVNINDLDIGNFNPFLIVNKNRSHEVHLPYYPPTDLVDMGLFGQYEDASIPAQNKYYVSSSNLPWGINIYENFDYPIEKQDIVGVHLKFAPWAISGGLQFPDWFKNLPGYRNNALIYQIPQQ